jgi:hypothetical protein
MEVGWVKKTHRTEYSVVKGPGNFDYFRVKPNLSITPNARHIWERCHTLAEYTQGNNHIVEVYSIGPNVEIDTRFYPDYYPMVFINECKNLYSDEVREECAQRYREFVRDPDRMCKMYVDIVYEFWRFSKATGLYFVDMSGNNILVNKDYSDYKIIDICSLDKIRPGVNVMVPPEAVLFTQKALVGSAKHDKTLMEYVGDAYPDMMKNMQQVNAISMGFAV